MITAWCAAVARAAGPELREYFEALVGVREIERGIDRSAIRAKYFMVRDWRTGRMCFEDEDDRISFFRECEQAESVLRDRRGPAEERLRIARGCYESRKTPADAKFYATMRDDRGRCHILDGPFATHHEALVALPEAKRIAEERDSRACWYSFGTASSIGATP